MGTSVSPWLEAAVTLAARLVTRRLTFAASDGAGAGAGAAAANLVIVNDLIAPLDALTVRQCSLTVSHPIFKAPMVSAPMVSAPMVSAPMVSAPMVSALEAKM
jgi:hypothetical protein